MASTPKRTRHSPARSHEAPGLTEHKIRRLISLAQSGDHSAQLDLVKGHTAFIKSIARRFYKPGAFLEFDDLFQQGCLGLLRAIEKFDLNRISRNRRVSFVSYAWYWIEDAIRREISNRGRTISIPENVISDVRRFRKDHAGKLRGGDPILDAGSLARMLNYPEEKWRRLSRAEYVFISEGDYQTDNESSGNMKGLAAPHAEDPVEVADAQTRADHLRQLLTKLPRRERHVIEQFYGLVEGQPPLTTLQLAQGMRISAERVRQIRIRALALLQFYSQSQLSQAATKPASKRWLATGSFRFIDALDDPKPNTK